MFISRVNKFIKKLFNVKQLAGAVILLALSLHGCENEPTDLGLNYVPPIDTLNTKVLDSRIDTILITGYNEKKFVNTGASANLFVGRYQNYESRGLLRFNGITSDYDSSTVLSAKLNFRYNKYFFRDSLGITSFNIYKLNKNFDFSSVTFDSVTSAEFGNLVLASYSGTPVDTPLISINFDNQTVADWFNYAADTNYVNKNYGMIFLPDLNSSTIKAFYSATQSAYAPTMTVVVSKNSEIDTLTLTSTNSVSLTDAPISVIPAERIILQSGLSYYGALKFDLAKLPSNVIINEAYIEFKLDNANSFYRNSDKRIAFSMITDSASLTSDNIYYYANLIDTVTYSVRINSIMQKWNSGTAVNYGVQLKGINDLTTLDRYAVYSPASSDISKRPYLRIIYTIRN